jgi:hypothetical protein
MCFLMPHMFDIMKLGGNSTRTNRPNLQCYGACHHGHPTRDICVRICETARGYEGCAKFFAAMSAVHSAANYRTVVDRGASILAPLREDQCNRRCKARSAPPLPICWINNLQE